ncbi:MAG: DNA gyrase subunit A [Thermoplasmata archaeon]
MEEDAETRTVKRPIEQEMESSYIDYAMSVIIGRALPDVRDGLKPVHRRILYAMKDMGLDSSKPHRKCARVVGETLGKYHPHGDQAIYDALVRMAQDFSLRYMLVDGHGNFGSVDGDEAAAMRYTECRLMKMANELLTDINKDTVDFVDNFDGSLKEPSVLPARLPNLLVNGSSGIAVGMSTNMPPHNLSEVVDGVVLLIENPDADAKELLEVIKGPDFPTGGTLYGTRGVWEAYSKGRGVVRVRAKAEVESVKKKRSIVVTEIPYMVNKSSLLEKIAHLVRDKKIDGIVDLRDESDREGMRIVMDLRRDANEDVILNQLYARTQMQSTFGIINIALVDGEPKVLTLKKMLQCFIQFREEIVRRRTEYDLSKAKSREHIVEGLITAVDNLDDVIALIRKSKDAEEARNGLIKRYELTEIQAKAVLEMRLQKLTGLEIENLRNEMDELKETIEELESILASEERILEIIKDEVLELKEKYGDERKTEIETHPQDLEIEDLIPVEDVVVTITNTGYTKQLPLDTYRQQRRGGVGLIGMETKEEDYVVDMFVTSTHNYILFFTNKGRVHWLKAWRLPRGGRHARGKPIVNLLPRLESGESISAMIPIKEFDESHYLVFATRKGKIKKTALKAYSNPRVTGIWAIKLTEGDSVVGVSLSDGGKEVVLATRQGKAARFSEKDFRATGRYTMGVKGVRLKGNDRVASLAVVDEDSMLLTITENGYGKRTPVRSYRRTKRGAVGVITIVTSKRNGPVVCAKKVDEEDELIITSVNGMIIRIPVTGIRVQGRATMGVKIMRLKGKDRVEAVARLVTEELAEVEEAEEPESAEGVEIDFDAQTRPSGDDEKA